MKRKFKRQLKEDEFVSTITKVVDFAQKRVRELIALAALLVIAALVFVGVRLIKAQNIKKESRLLSDIITLHEELSEKPENVAKLEELAGKGKFSRVAYLFLASHWVEKGDLDRAQETLQKASGGEKDLFYFQAKDLQAQIHIKRKEYDQAIEIYKEIAEENPDQYTLDAVLFRQAEALEQKGETAQALALYRKVQEDFPQTFFGYDASQKVRKLEERK